MEAWRCQSTRMEGNRGTEKGSDGRTGIGGDESIGVRSH